jgi:hypothetical protein
MGSYIKKGKNCQKLILNFIEAPCRVKALGRVTMTGTLYQTKKITTLEKGKLKLPTSSWWVEITIAIICEFYAKLS